MKVKNKTRVKKGETGSVKIDPDILYEAKKYCREKGILLYAYINNAVNNQLMNDKE